MDQLALDQANISARQKQALSEIVQDAANTERGASESEVKTAMGGKPSFKLIEELWNHDENKSAIKKFLENRLCTECAQGKPKALEAYKRYAVQDYFYLVDYIKFKALRLVTVPQNDLETLKSEADSVGHSYQSAATWRDTCINDLKIPENDFKQDRSVAELAYANFLQNNSHVDDWFNLHVIMIACTYGWSFLALELYHQYGNSIDENNIFYKNWIKPNLEFDDKKNPQLPSYALKLANFLDVNREQWASKGDVEKWHGLFRTSLRLEAAMFESAFSMSE